MLQERYIKIQIPWVTDELEELVLWRCYKSLSRLLEILYPDSFWAATSALSVRSHKKTFEGQIWRIKKVLAVFPLQRHNFAASSSNVRVDIKCSPQMIYWCRHRHCSNANENANVRLRNRAYPEVDWGSTQKKQKHGISFGTTTCHACLHSLLESHDYTRSEKQR
jgi:hypothetical protein